MEHFPIGCFEREDTVEAISTIRIHSYFRFVRPYSHGVSCCMVNWGAGFMMSSELSSSVIQLKFIDVHSPRHFCAVGLRRQERDHEKVMRWCSHELARGTRQRGKERSGKSGGREWGQAQGKRERAGGVEFTGKTRTNTRPRLEDGWRCHCHCHCHQTESTSTSSNQQSWCENKLVKWP